MAIDITRLDLTSAGLRAAPGKAKTVRKRWGQVFKRWGHKRWGQVLV